MLFNEDVSENLDPFYNTHHILVLPSRFYWTDWATQYSRFGTTVKSVGSADEVKSLLMKM